MNRKLSSEIKLRAVSITPEKELLPIGLSRFFQKISQSSVAYFLGVSLNSPVFPHAKIKALIPALQVCSSVKPLAGSGDGVQPRPGEAGSIAQIVLLCSVFFKAGEESISLVQKILRFRPSILTIVKLSSQTVEKRKFGEKPPAYLLAIEHFFSQTAVSECQVIFTDSPVFKKSIVLDAVRTKHKTFLVKVTLPACSKHGMDLIKQVSQMPSFSGAYSKSASQIFIVGFVDNKALGIRLGGTVALFSLICPEEFAAKIQVFFFCNSLIELISLRKKLESIEEESLSRGTSRESKENKVISASIANFSLLRKPNKKKVGSITHSEILTRNLSSEADNKMKVVQSHREPTKRNLRLSAEGKITNVLDKFTEVSVFSTNFRSSKSGKNSQSSEKSIDESQTQTKNLKMLKVEITHPTKSSIDVSATLRNFFGQRSSSSNIFPKRYVKMTKVNNERTAQSQGLKLDFKKKQIAFVEEVNIKSFLIEKYLSDLALRPTRRNSYIKEEANPIQFSSSLSDFLKKNADAPC